MKNMVYFTIFNEDKLLIMFKQTNNQKYAFTEKDLIITFQNSDKVFGNIMISFGKSTFYLNKSLRESLFTFVDRFTSNHTFETIIKPLIMNHTPITLQPRKSIAPQLIHLKQPQSLFLCAIIKLSQTSQIIINFDNAENRPIIIDQTLRIEDSSTKNALPELGAPESLTSAPPSYSFVLRQINARRRPRFMGTFIPSPSFIQHAPPPNYAQAFDIYIDNPLLPPPRPLNYGFHPMLVVCPECGFVGTTSITTRITFCTHLCAIILCLCCCWLCVPLPYLLRSCKDVYHYCGNCRFFLGIYSPTNPENV